MPDIRKIAIIGAGNAGTYLTSQLCTRNFEVEIFSRSGHESQLLSEFLEQSSSFQLVLLCVTDDAIKNVSAALPAGDYLVAHVSGATDIEAIDPKHLHRAVFYPLMSLQSTSHIPIETIPFCLEADNAADLMLLKNLVMQLGAVSYEVNSLQRTHLHLAAVLAHNFSNHLFHIAFQVMQQQGLDFKMLLPLLRNLLLRLEEKPPRDLQTGPAVRGDVATQQRHLSLLNEPHHRQLYALLSQLIQNNP